MQTAQIIGQYLSKKSLVPMVGLVFHNKLTLKWVKYTVAMSLFFSVSLDVVSCEMHDIL